jgi:exopolyphosphatase/pppGpp-phosphohydrolase
VRDAALVLAGACGYDRAHTHQVTRLALRLFDELQPQLGLGAEVRLWLELGALLHDIGWCEGRRGHHRTALRLILASPDLPLGERERRLVGNIARYHRKAAPSLAHAEYAALATADRELVRAAAAILRVADALDYSHRQLVSDLACGAGDRTVDVRCRARDDISLEAERAVAKGNLLRELLGRDLVITWEIA